MTTAADPPAADPVAAFAAEVGPATAGPPVGEGGRTPEGMRE